MEKTVVVCERCMQKVYPSCLDEYDYQCFEHDEDLYECETITMNEEEFFTMWASAKDCSKEEIKNIYDHYDAYISKTYLHDDPVDAPMSFNEFFEDYRNKQDMTMQMFQM